MGAQDLGGFEACPAEPREGWRPVASGHVHRPRPPFGPIVDAVFVQPVLRCLERGAFMALIAGHGAAVGARGMRLIGQRIGAMLASACLLMALPAAAQSFDPAWLSADDRAALEALLEVEQTNRLRRLPDSGAEVTIVRTETRPRICRYFVIESTGNDRRNGVGCRGQARQWELAGTSVAVPPAPSAPVAASPAPPRGDRPATAPAPTTIPAPVTAPAAARADGLAMAPAPAVAVQAPARVATATRPDVPRPGRRPGDTIPLAAAPAAARAVPLPAVRPAVAGPQAESGDEPAEPTRSTTRSEEPPTSDAQAVATAPEPPDSSGELARPDLSSDIAAPRRRPAGREPIPPPTPGAGTAEPVADANLHAATDEPERPLARLTDPPVAPLPLAVPESRRPGPPGDLEEPSVWDEAETGVPTASADDTAAPVDGQQVAGNRSENDANRDDPGLRLVNAEGIAALPLPRRRPYESGQAAPETPRPRERPAEPL